MCTNAEATIGHYILPETSHQAEDLYIVGHDQLMHQGQPWLMDQPSHSLDKGGCSLFRLKGAHCLKDRRRMGKAVMLLPHYLLFWEL